MTDADWRRFAEVGGLNQFRNQAARQLDGTGAPLEATDELADELADEARALAEQDTAAGRTTGTPAPPPS